MRRIGIIFILIITGIFFTRTGLAEVLEIKKVPADFSVRASLEKWREISQTMVIRGDLRIGSASIPVQIFLFYNDYFLFWGFLVEDAKPFCPDDFSPEFSGSDHLKLWFHLYFQRTSRFDSLLILPESIFREPLVTPDYRFYQTEFSLPWKDLQVSAKFKPDSYFITLAIPFSILKVTPPNPGDAIDFDLALYKTLPGESGITAWITSNSSEPGFPISGVIVSL